MATPLKYMYNPAYFEKICPVLRECVPGFDYRDFIFRIFNNDWPEKELKQRVRHIATVLHEFLDKDFPVAARQLVLISRTLMASTRPQGFENIFLPDYVERYGLDHPDESLAALGEITRLVSAEYAVRPFILRFQDKALRYLKDWSHHADANVRRLASEGCRPRLPWGMALPPFKEDPSPVLPILDTLKADSSEYVRKSVANNLNDIGKDHPEVVLRLVAKWKGKHPHTDWILRHGCRSLLKKGDTDALSLHGFNPESKARVRQLLLPEKVRIGDYLNFEFAFLNAEKQPTPFRLEYAIDYLTSTGKISRKVFKLKEHVFLPGQSVRFSRRQSFSDFSTRKHFPGKHRLSILANGKKLAVTEFLVC